MSKLVSWQGGGVFSVSIDISNRSPLDGSVLLLNAHYLALRVISVRRAISMLFKYDESSQPAAEVINVENGQYVSYCFADWAELSVFQKEFEPAQYDWLRTVRFDIAVPRIIRVLSFSRIPKRIIKFNRRNIFARDSSTCQYCGKHFPTSELSLDHVTPRSQGGPASWENIVCACVRCNVKKGGRTPAQAHMKLIKEPQKPKRNPVLSIRLSDDRYASWKQFLDAAYWDVELG